MKSLLVAAGVVLGLAVVIALATKPVAVASGSGLSTAVANPATNPIANRTRPHLDHSAFFEAPLESGPAVTAKCLECHPEAAKEVMQTPHWTWLSGDAQRGGETVRIGKKNLMNNFCISVSGNWASCTKCHAGYGWTDAKFDFTQHEQVDCLVCHDGSGTYVKDKGGLPRAGTDLTVAAASVRAPFRENCGVCHFNGGGGMGVKHGDLDDSLLNANEETDVHMGRLGFQCIDCHETHGHVVPGKLNATYSEATRAERFDCTKCHTEVPHADAVLNKHVERLACQSCHVPSYARKFGTKMEWDWSQAGDSSRKDEPHEYLKIKGSFRYDESVQPEYAWYNGKMDRYLTGDPLSSDDQAINQPLGSRQDPTAKLWPFKVHRAKQLYDPVRRVLIPPVTSGEDGYWTKFDWELAARKGMEIAGLPYSGKYDFVATHMYWPITHMVAPAKHAVQCKDCHGEGQRLDWQALGYERDPAGGRRREN